MFQLHEETVQQQFILCEKKTQKSKQTCQTRHFV